MVCLRCQKKVCDSDRIVCQGYCGATFHAVCVNVDEPLREQLGINGTNVFWMCNGCANLFTNAHFRTMMTGFDNKTDDLPKAMQTMQIEIEKLHSALNVLSDKVDAKHNTPTPFATPNGWPNLGANGNRLDSMKNTPKRRRGMDGISVATPSVTSNMGTKKVNAIKTVRLAGRPTDDLFWIHLSAFHPTTTDNQIATLVSECLDLSNMQPKVVKLVPKGRDLDSLQFVSFKVGIKVELKDNALSSESWPENIRYREFEDYRAKNAPRVVTLSSMETSDNILSSAMETTNSSMTGS